MKRYISRIAPLLAALSLACASAGQHGGSRISRDPNLITADEIATISVTNAYDAIKRLRPNFLAARGSTSFTPRPTYPNVYVDGVRYGDITTLNGIEASHIATIRYYNAADAEQRFGTDNVGGAIAITTKQ